MKRAIVVLLCVLFGMSFAQSGHDLETVQERALETFKVIRAANPAPASLIPWRTEKNKCDMGLRNFYAGKPFLVHSLIHLTEGDLTRLRHRIEAAKREDPRFEGNARKSVREARLNYQNYYEVPIYHHTCGYMFHVEPGDEKDGSFGWGPFKPVDMKKAQTLLGSTKPPTFTLVQSLSFQHDGYMWILGSRAVDAFNPSKRYRIVNRKGKPVAPLKTRLIPIIFRESFGWPDGTPSAYWHFLLPVKLEPLPLKP